LEAELVGRTLRSLADDLEISAVRVGMLGSGEVAEAVADFLEEQRLPNVVLDPVIRSSSGVTLLDAAGQEVLRRRLLPLCDVVTPNVDEAAAFCEVEVIPADAAWEEVLPRLRLMAGKLLKLGAKGVVITGGHLAQPNDYLTWRTGETSLEQVFPGTHLPTKSTHGTGCAFATAIACQLARGRALPEAVRAAKEYVTRAIAAAYPMGKGAGPINHGV